jgi:hypothetical protein
MSAPTSIVNGTLPISEPTEEPVTEKNLIEQQTNPVGPQGSWEARIRALEPQKKGEEAERLELKRAAMIAANRRSLRMKEIAKRWDSEAEKALREYREEIPYGHWGKLEPVLREGYGDISERSFSRRLAAPKKGVEGFEELPKSGQLRTEDSEPAVNRPLTRTEQFRADHARESRDAFTKSARAERSDVFLRRICGQLETRFRGGDEGSLAERLRTARMLVAKLGLTPTDLTG